MTGRAERERRLHDEYRVLMAAAVDGRIDPDDAVALEAHLATCAECRADQQAMFDDHVWLATSVQVSPPDPRIRSYVLEAARSASVPRTAGGRDRPWAALAAASLIVAVIGVGLVFSVTRPSVGDRPTASAGTSPVASPSGPVVPPVGQACVPIPTDLSARWSFDEPTEHLTGAELRLAGTAAWTIGIHGGALHLDGSSAQASVREPGWPNLGLGDFTVSVWVRFTTTDAEQVLIESWRDSPAMGWTLTKLATREIRLAVATNRGSAFVDTAGAPLVPARWHHVAARVQGDRMTVFVDDLQTGAGTMGAGERVDATSSETLLFGRRGGGDTRGFNLRGDLDEALIWNRALTDAEIDDLWRAGEAPFCEAAAGAGYAGTWETTDCATNGAVVDCARWGDGSALRLTIGAGETPEASFEDVEAAGCGAGGSSGPRLATGRGEFEGTYLWLTFTDIRCDAPSESWTNPMQLHKLPYEQSMWDDHDGDNWGLVWHRA